MAKKKETTIPTWTLFGTHSVGLELHHVEGTDKYQLGLTVFLDDGEEFPDDSDKQKVITVFTDRGCSEDELDDFIYESVIATGNFFETVGQFVFIIDPNGGVEKEIDLNVFMESHQNSDKKQKSSGVTFH